MKTTIELDTLMSDSQLYNWESRIDPCRLMHSPDESPLQLFLKENYMKTPEFVATHNWQRAVKNSDIMIKKCCVMSEASSNLYVFIYFI